MTTKCPRCHRGSLETWGIEATHLPTGKVFEQGMITGCPRCGWHVPIKDELREVKHDQDD